MQLIRQHVLDHKVWWKAFLWRLVSLGAKGAFPAANVLRMRSAHCLTTWQADGLVDDFLAVLTAEQFVCVECKHLNVEKLFFEISEIQI